MQHHSQPWFSIVVSVFNRPGEIARCIDSCLSQTFTDFEMLVVDDASTDDTVAVIKSYNDPRIRLLCHSNNQGMSSARATGFESAQGQWVIRIDSDHALVPTALETFWRICRDVANDVGVVGACYQWDNGWITPPAFPSGPMDYIQRIQWRESGTDNDYVHCTRHQICSEILWPKRRGSTNALMELNIARQWKTILIADCLGLQFTDAENSFHRTRRDKKLAQRIRDAAAQATTYKEILDLHGDALQKYAPTRYIHYCLMAGFHYFLAGDRSQGRFYILNHIKERPMSIYGWVILFAGMIGLPALKAVYMLKGKKLSF